MKALFILLAVAGAIYLGSLGVAGIEASQASKAQAIESMGE